MHATVSAPVFQCDVQPDRERVLVHLAGEMDLAVAGTVGATLRDLFDVGFTSMVVDLREVSFMDSSGLDVLLSARQRAAEIGGRLSLVRGPDEVQRVFALTGTTALFTFDDARTFR
jgi:anti-sigma B factor antagonist